MAEAAPPQEAAPKKKKSLLPILIGLVAAVVLGGGGFYAVYSGLILGAGAAATDAAHGEAAAEGHGEAPATDAAAHGAAADPLPDIGFVAVTPVTIPLGAAGRNQNLRLTAQLEVAKPHMAEVSALMPRILDVMNSYLRAVEVAQLQDPSALVRIRAQLLRRIQIVTGTGRVRDLLVTEFMIN